MDGLFRLSLDEQNKGYTKVLDRWKGGLVVGNEEQLLPEGSIFNFKL